MNEYNPLKTKQVARSEFDNYTKWQRMPLNYVSFADASFKGDSTYVTELGVMPSWIRNVNRETGLNFQRPLPKTLVRFEGPNKIHTKCDRFPGNVEIDGQAEHNRVRTLLWHPAPKETSNIFVKSRYEYNTSFNATNMRSNHFAVY